VPPKPTAVAPVKLVPVMITEVPAPPDVGLNPLIVGADVKVNVPLLVAVPPGVTTETVPVVPVPTTAVIWVLELTV